MNALEQYRTANQLTYEQLAKLAGFAHRSVALGHCRAAIIPGEAALRYHLKLGIPLLALRPDLFLSKN